MKNNHNISDYIDLRATPYEVLIEIAKAVEKGEWHPALGPAPEGWDEMRDTGKTEYTLAIAEGIENSVGLKALFRYHHMHDLGRTDQQFEDWWDSRNSPYELIDYIYDSREAEKQAIERNAKHNKEYMKDAILSLLIFIFGVIIGAVLVLA